MFTIKLVSDGIEYIVGVYSNYKVANNKATYYNELLPEYQREVCQYIVVD